MHYILKLFFIFTAFLSITACDNQPKSLGPAKYAEWITSEKHGLRKERNIKNVMVSARFLPAPYLAFREWQSSDSVSYDSILNSYKCGLSFQIDMQADKADKTYGNLMFYNITNQEEFAAKSRYLNFNIQEFITLENGKIKLEPVLSHFEGYDALGNRLSFRIVFIVPEYNCGVQQGELNNLKLIFDDPFWDMGTINFEFNGNNILNIPALKI